MRVNAYLARIVERVWSELFEKRCGWLLEWMEIRSAPRPDIILCLSPFFHPLRLGKMETRLDWEIRGSVAGKIEDRSIIRLRITSRLDTSADETDQSATPLSAGFRFIGERAVNSAVIFPPIGCTHFSVSNQIARGKKFIRPPCFPSQITTTTLLLSPAGN